LMPPRSARVQTVTSKRGSAVQYGGDVSQRRTASRLMAGRKQNARQQWAVRAREEVLHPAFWTGRCIAIFGATGLGAIDAAAGPVFVCCGALFGGRLLPAGAAAGTVRTSGLDESLPRPSPDPRLLWPRPVVGLAALSDDAVGAADLGVAMAAAATAVWATLTAW